MVPTALSMTPPIWIVYRPAVSYVLRPTGACRGRKPVCTQGRVLHFPGTPCPEDGAEPGFTSGRRVAKGHDGLSPTDWSALARVAVAAAREIPLVALLHRRQLHLADGGDALLGQAVGGLVGGDLVPLRDLEDVAHDLVDAGDHAVGPLPVVALQLDGDVHQA